MKKTNKLVVYTIEFKTNPEDANLLEILDELRGFGWAEIVDVKVEENKKND